jgi:ornithine decarboxylase
VRPATPCLVLDLDVVADQYRHLRAALPLASVYYAVKANPAPEIVSVLAGLGASFDVASPSEIDLCLAAGVDASALSYGSTIKKARDIAYAYQRGVRLFAFDSIGELEKIAEAAPGSEVVCRILTSNEGAEWPLSRKFGCEIEMAAGLLGLAGRLGLVAAGVTFHVGSQQRHPRQWDEAIALTGRLFSELASAGVNLRMVNLGGGFPAHYRGHVPPIEAYAEAIMKAMDYHFGSNQPEMVVEPGRYLTGDAGVIRSEVVLVSWKCEGDDKRWVFLDVGIFGGLAEAMGEAIKYHILTSRDGGPVGPVVIAGPTCDSVDILYEQADYRLPLDLTSGDTVDILAAGAYTTCYSTVGFNGFGPLACYCI